MVWNQIKTVLLLGALTGLLLVVGQLLGGTAGLTIAFTFALIINFISYFFSDKIVLFMYRAKEADKRKYSKLYNMVKHITELANMPMPKVYIVPDQQANAFATGRNPKHAVVACTEGILELLNDKELKGVIAHEVAHIKNRDILISTVAAVIAGTISYIAAMARWGAIFGGGNNRNGNNLVSLIILGILTPIIALIIQLAISRSREFLADNTGSKIIRDPNGLADALTKLHSSSKARPMRRATSGTAHIFIVNPLSGKSVWNLLSTHPSLEARVGKLRSMVL